MVQLIKLIIAVILGFLMIHIGIHHFRNPQIYDDIVPTYLGFPRFWTLLSGIVEIILGIGLIIKFSRQITARFLIVFYLVVYLANLNMWVNDIPFSGNNLSQIGHSIRLLIQIILIIICIWISDFKCCSSYKKK
ncbi:MAG: hypothetical protein CMO36_06585 [Verrucomicrobiaceae bacterium]|nr:hypothetical protein [Verrucomicrobiales bacterium]MBN77862.1 hypothetical protein [Verrucomicrobiaceae bacterium]